MKWVDRWHASRARWHHRGHPALGTLVVNEIVLPIIDIRLQEGLLYYIGRLGGPISAFEGGLTEFEVFGEDGRLIGSWRSAMSSWPAIEEGHGLTIPVSMSLIEVRETGGPWQAVRPSVAAD